MSVRLIRQLGRETQQRRNRQLSFKLLRTSSRSKQKAFGRCARDKKNTFRSCHRRATEVYLHFAKSSFGWAQAEQQSREYGIKLQAIFASAERAAHTAWNYYVSPERHFSRRARAWICIFIFRCINKSAATPSRLVYFIPLLCGKLLSVRAARRKFLFKSAKKRLPSFVVQWECLISAFYLV